jgi:uncharacterized protein YjbI with pentapeptide repeats
LSLFIILPVLGTITIVHKTLVDRSQEILRSKNCSLNTINTKGDIRSSLQYLWWTGHKLDLVGIQACEESLHNINLSGANLSDSNLQGVNLISADLHLVFLTGANLRDAEMAGVDLSRSILRNANLEGARLQGANLEGARLQGANLQNADLTDVNLIGVKGLSADQLKKAKTICRAKIPQNLIINTIEIGSCKL